MKVTLAPTQVRIIVDALGERLDDHDYTVEFVNEHGLKNVDVRDGSYETAKRERPIIKDALIRLGQQSEVIATLSDVRPTDD